MVICTKGDIVTDAERELLLWLAFQIGGRVNLPMDGIEGKTLRPMSIDEQHTRLKELLDRVIAEEPPNIEQKTA